MVDINAAGYLCRLPSCRLRAQRQIDCHVERQIIGGRDDDSTPHLTRGNELAGDNDLAGDILMTRLKLMFSPPFSPHFGAKFVVIFVVRGCILYCDIHLVAVLVVLSVPRPPLIIKRPVDVWDDFYIMFSVSALSAYYSTLLCASYATVYNVVACIAAAAGQWPNVGYDSR